MYISKFLRKGIVLLLTVSLLLSLCAGIFATESSQEPVQEPATQDPGEEKPDTKDVRGPDYVFLDFEVGSASRNFNWQVKTDSSSNPYFAPNKQGCIAGYFSGDDPQLYMPVETHSSGLKRLGSYVLKSGDIVKVYVKSITANSYFTSGGTGTYNSGFYVRTSNDVDAWASCGVKTIKRQTAGQTIQWSTPAAQVGKTLYGVRWDPIQPTDAQKGTFTKDTRIYVDYIYVGPADLAPVSVDFQDETGATLSQSFGYVGYGKKAPAWNHGKVDSQTATQATLWGWEVSQYIDGAWTVVNPFLADPTSFTCKYDTRFRLTSVTIPTAEPQGNQYLSAAESTDRYNLTMNASSVADATLSGYGTPLDVTLVMDHSGSMSDLTSTKKLTTEAAMTEYLDTLDKTKFPGYYRASCWRRNYDQGGYGYYGWRAYVYHMPMRYYRGQWQMQVVQKDCKCNGTSHRNFGIYPFNNSMEQCSHVQWVSMADGFALYEELCVAQGCPLSMQPFEIGPCRLGRNQYAIESFLQKLYNSSANLKSGQYHTVSILSYGANVFATGYPYSNQNGSYKTENNVNISKVSTKLDYSSYESILSTLRDTYVYGATRTDAAMQVLSGELSTIEESAGMTAPSLTKTKYLRTSTSNRKRVVILMSDGISSSNNAFDNTVATEAIDAARRIKSNSYTTVYTVGMLSGLDAAKYYTSSYSTGTEVQKANNFLNLLSSRYKNATAYNSPGTRTAGNYYLVGTSAGDYIASQCNTLWDSTSHSIIPIDRNALYLYQEIAPEFMIDSGKPIQIFAEPYLGNGTYGERVPIGEHSVSTGSQPADFSGNGYTLHIAPIAETGGFSVSLQWTDAPTAYARETAIDLGSKATVMTRTALDTSKGYRISAVLPLAINWDKTNGGRGVKVTTSSSGVYSSSSGTAMGSLLLPYDVPAVDIPFVGANLVSRTISLKGNIGVNYYMGLSDEIAADADAYMRFTYADGSIQDIRIGEPGSDFSSSTGCYTFSCQVTAKEMADQIKCQFFYGENSATKENLYSVKTYADRMLTNSNSSEKLTTLLTKMLHYGAASQLHFGYNTDSLANAGMEAPDYSGAVIEGFEVNRNQGTSLVTFAGASLLLKSETTLRLFFNVDSSAVASLTISYKGEALALSQRSGKYYVDIPNISAKNLDDDFVVSVFDGTDTAEVSYCPLSYCASILANVNGTYTKQLQDVAVALYEYNKAANNYFG